MVVPRLCELSYLISRRSGKQKRWSHTCPHWCRSVNKVFDDLVGGAVLHFFLEEVPFLPSGGAAFPSSVGCFPPRFRVLQLSYLGGDTALEERCSVSRET